MKRKQSGNHQAAPAASRGALQQQKKKDNVNRVQQDIHVVGSGRMQAEKLTVESVGKPGQGMPVPLIISGKSPFHCRPRQARLHMRVGRDVSIVVKIEEPVVSYRVIEHQHHGGQQQTQQQGALRRRLKQLGGSRNSRLFEAFRHRGSARRAHGFNYSHSRNQRGRDGRQKEASDSRTHLAERWPRPFLRQPLSVFRPPALAHS